MLTYLKKWWTLKKLKIDNGLFYEHRESEEIFDYLTHREDFQAWQKARESAAKLEAEKAQGHKPRQKRAKRAEAVQVPVQVPVAESLL